ncbi:MAG: CvpA family protein [Cardiobacteriaceae bacterium]|nr:CvpA family protein [Cardiobacteriaceae bacterium]
MDLNELNYLDAVLGGIVIISTLISIGRGLVREILSLIAWGFSLYLAFRFADQIAQQHIDKFFESYPISYMLAFGGIFMLSLFAIGLLNLLIGEIMAATKLGSIDRLLGTVFGFMRGLIIGAIVTFIATLFSMHHEPWWQTSKLAPTFVRLAHWGEQRLPREVINIVHNIRNQNVGVLPYREISKPAGADSSQRPVLRLESTSESNQ